MLLCGLLSALSIPAGVELPERKVSAIYGVIAMEYLVVDDESSFSFPTRLPKRLRRIRLETEVKSPSPTTVKEIEFRLRDADN
ncbi:hypothetical protein RIF29_12556 [Crotalaria pallida]|uniref:Uncharacterized protein n=1 Tax=Crotalaria pallida TaxID=3830 RepID=A0AAN9P159_CROPI